MILTIPTTPFPFPPHFTLPRPMPSSSHPPHAILIPPSSTHPRSAPCHPHPTLVHPSPLRPKPFSFHPPPPGLQDARVQEDSVMRSILSLFTLCSTIVFSFQCHSDAFIPAIRRLVNLTTTCYLLLTTYYLPLTTYHLLFSICFHNRNPQAYCLHFTTYYLPLTTYYLVSSSIAAGLLITVYFLPPTTYHSPLTT